MSNRTAPATPAWLAQVKIRPLRRNDLPALEWEGEFTHFRRLYETTYSSAMVGRTLMWVAELTAHGVIGQVFTQLISNRIELADGKDRAYIYGFRIRPAYRGQGLGSKMLKLVEIDLQQRGFRFVTLNVGQDNILARKLYERMGYRVVDSDPGEWSYLDHDGVHREVSEPAWRMEKTLKTNTEDDA